jgi:hypothetical protein
MGYELAIRPALRGQPVAWFAPTYKLLGEAWRGIRTTVAPIIKSANATDHRIELITGGVIEMWTLLDEDAGRSRMYKRAIIDEAGLVPDLGDRWHTAISPTLADLEGDAWFLGTPKGRNFFWQAYQWGQESVRDEWASWQMPTTVNSRIKASEIERMRQDMPERKFLQEVEAQFLDEDGAVFRQVMQASRLQPQGAIPGHEYVMGVDWGKIADATVFSIIDVTTNEQVHLDRMTQVDYHLQLERLRIVNDRYKPFTIFAERNSMGEPLIEQLLRMDYPVQPFTTTNASKARLIEGLQLALERGEIALLKDKTQIDELNAFEAEQLPSGMTRYSAPEGMHDDIVMALALSVKAAGMGVTFSWIDA